MARFDWAEQVLNRMERSSMSALSDTRLLQLTTGPRAIDVALVPNLSAAVVSALLSLSSPHVRYVLAANDQLSGQGLDVLCEHIVATVDTGMLDRALCRGSLQGHDTWIQGLFDDVLARVVDPAQTERLAPAALTLFTVPELLERVRSWPAALQVSLVATLVDAGPRDERERAWATTVDQVLRTLDVDRREQVIVDVLHRAPEEVDQLAGALAELVAERPLSVPLTRAGALGEAQARMLWATGDAQVRTWVARSVLCGRAGNWPELLGLVLADRAVVEANTDVAGWGSSPAREAYVAAAAELGVVIQPQILADAPAERAALVGWLTPFEGDCSRLEEWLAAVDPADESVVALIDEIIDADAPVDRKRRAKWLRRHDLLVDVRGALLDSVGRWAYLPVGRDGHSGAAGYHLADLVDEPLGGDAGAWERFLDQLPTWEGSLSQLVAVAKAP